MIAPVVAPISPAAAGDAVYALAHLAPLIEQAAGYARRATASSTARAYAADWRDFRAWCGAQGLPALPAAPEAVALYLAAAAPHRRVATLQRRLSAIREIHREAGHPLDLAHATLRAVWAGIRRTHSVAPVQKAPVLIGTLRALVATLPPTLVGTRDCALLVFGWAGAFRRSELVALDVEDVAITAQGLVVALRRSKTDQEGRGRKVAVPYGSNPATCPVRTLLAWREAAAAAGTPLEAGPLFRAIRRRGAGHRVLAERLSDRGVARVVQRAAQAAGLDPARFAGHSLRAGFATTAAAAGAPDRAIMRQTGHTRRETLDRYVREGDLWRENAASLVGL